MNVLFNLGIGLHLQKLCHQDPQLLQKQGLHETHRLLVELSPYDHLHRLFRLCTVHFMRNIRRCQVDEEVRHMMRSLMCLRHPDWDGTIQAICERGGKPAIGTVSSISTLYAHVI